MKNKIVLSIGIVALSSVMMFSCSKDKNVASVAGSTPITKLLSDLVTPDTTVKDFNVIISSSYGNSVYPGGNGEPMTALAGYSKNFTNVGTLSINNTAILMDTAGHYIHQTDSTLKSTSFCGVNDNIIFTGKDATIMPSFRETLYSPTNTPLTYTGLTNYKLDRTGTLQIKWTPDPGYSTATNGNAYIIVQGENEGSRVRSTPLIKTVLDNSGVATLSSSELSQFNGFSSITILYGKGYYKIGSTSGKQNYLVQFLNYSYTNIYFN